MNIDQGFPVRDFYITLTLYQTTKFWTPPKLKQLQTILNVPQLTICVYDKVENIAGKEENAGYQYFLNFPQCLQKSSLSRQLKMGLCGKGFGYFTRA